MNKKSKPTINSKPTLPNRLLVELGDMKQKNIFFLLAETFQALGDSSRVQIVWALTKREMHVNELAEFLGMSQPAVSHHLRTLRNLKLVKTSRVGRINTYSLDDEHINQLLAEGLKHVDDLVAHL